MSHQSNTFIALFLAVALLQFTGAFAQDFRHGGTAAASAHPSSAQAVPVALRIAPGDLLEVSVFDAPELTQQVRVGADGTVQLALIGQTRIAGLTAQEASERIAQDLREGQYLLRPQVNVLIKEFASQGVSVSGEVKNPGVYQVPGARTLLDVISMAGGLTPVADTRVTVKRRTGSREQVTVALRTDNAAANVQNDVQIYPGDLVVVPRAGVVYVLGDVNRPGGFVMQDSGAITLLQALAQAGGATRTASLNGTVLLRKTGNGYSTNKLRVAKITRGHEGDIELHANDIVFVPSNRLKSAAHDIQSIASSVASASIYAVVR